MRKGRYMVRSTEKPGANVIIVCYYLSKIERNGPYNGLPPPLHLSIPLQLSGRRGACYTTNGLFATGGTHTHGRLERIVDPPLEASQGTNHDNTGTETLGGKGNKSGLGGDSTDGLALVSGFAQQGDQRVSRVGNDGANNTREVTRTEGDSELSGLAVGVLGVGEHVGVEELDDLLEEVELGHGVWDL